MSTNTNAATTSSTRPRGGRQPLLRSIAVLTAAGAAMAISLSGAVFTDSDDITVSDITTGSIALTPSSTTMDFSLTDIVPGDTSAVQPLTLTNAGTAELRYSLTSTTTEDTLAAELDLDLWLESDEDVPDGTCGNGTAAPFLYQDLPIGSVAGTAILGDPTQGADAGDRVLAAAANELLCFEVNLPLATGDTVQATTTTVTFTFDSEQTGNNA